MDKTVRNFWQFLYEMTFTPWQGSNYNLIYILTSQNKCIKVNDITVTKNTIIQPIVPCCCLATLHIVTVVEPEWNCLTLNNKTDKEFLWKSLLCNLEVHEFSQNLKATSTF
jgi:hypothetical protein